MRRNAVEWIDISCIELVYFKAAEVLGAINVARKKITK